MRLWLTWQNSPPHPTPAHRGAHRARCGSSEDPEGRAGSTLGGLYHKGPTNNADARSVAAASSGVGRPGPASLVRSAGGAMLQHAHLSPPGCGCPVPGRASEQGGKKSHSTSLPGARPGPASCVSLSMAACLVISANPGNPNATLAWDSSRGAGHLISLPPLVQASPSLRWSWLGWIPGQAEWNRWGPCTRRLTWNREAAQSSTTPPP